MTDFSILYKEYERTHDICKFCDDYSPRHAATRFLLVRSLDTNNLKDIVATYSTENTNGTWKVLAEKAYRSSVTIDQLVDYISEKRSR